MLLGASVIQRRANRLSLQQTRRKLLTSDLADAERDAPTKRLGFLDRVQYAYAVFGMILYQGAISSPLRSLRGAPPMAEGDSDISIQIAQAIIFLGFIAFGWKYRWQVLRSIRIILPITLLLGLCVVSVIWSEFPQITLRKCVTLLTAVLFGMYCYFRYGLARTTKIVADTTSVLAALSLAVYFLVPSMGREPSEEYRNALAGLYGQKNFVAAAMLIASNYYLWKMFRSRLSLKETAGFALILACLVLSMSATGMGILAVVFILNLMDYARGRWRLRLIVTYVFAIFAFVLVLGLIVSPAATLGIIGRDLSLTGRVPLWQLAIQAIEAKPILGYGYFAFWNANSPTVQYIWDQIGWPAEHSHDAYLDVLLQLGVVGLILYIWIIGRIALMAGWAQRTRGFPEARWVVGFITIILIRNIDEGAPLYPNEFVMLMTTSLLALESYRLSRQSRASMRRARNLEEDAVTQ